MSLPALLALGDGSIFHGQGIGVTGEVVGEVIFNTAMTGYQEILTDPSYAKQIITFTCPHIGNVGFNQVDRESRRIWSSGLIVREPSLLASNWRSEISLQSYLEQNKVVGISGIDTRALTHLLRDKGALRGCIIHGEAPDQAAARAKAKAFAGLSGMDLAKVVSTPEPYTWAQPTWDPSVIPAQAEPQLEKKTAPYHVVVYDFGVKYNILRLLVDRGCRLTIVPAQTSAKDVLTLKPHAVFLSNGPGDPAACDYAIENIQYLLQHDIPLFGICLGFQLLALACGAKTIKMKFGHHGANHPVRCEQTQRVFITSQNHGFAVDEKSLPHDLQVTHRSLFDGSLQGIQHTTKAAFGFQGHPEASPGPHDVIELFDDFVALIEARSNLNK